VLLWAMAVVIVVLLGGLVYVWRQRAPLAPGSMARRAPLPAMMNLRKSTLIVAGILVLALCGGAFLLVRGMWQGFRRTPVVKELSKARRGGAPASFLDRFPKEYGVQTAAEAQPTTPAPATPTPPGSPATPTPPPTQPPGKPGTRALPPAPTPPKAPQVVIQGGGPGPAPKPVSVRQAAGQVQAQPEAPHNWFSSPQQRQGNVLGPPLPEDKDDATKSALFPKAVWEKPADPYKILYADQIVPVLLAQSINTDQPGTLRLKVPQDVTDRWGHGHVLIPADTTFMAVQEGKADFGQTRIPLKVYMAIFPDSSAAYWEGGQVGDAMGANGLPANVDNHYAKLLLGVGLQALLSVGARAPFGSPGQGQFQQNLPQEFAQDAAQGINQAGSRILRRFEVPPTLSQEFGYAGTISFMKNVSFQTDPVVIRK
jgi:type IV secretory pathway VirB10-like protein